MRAGVLYVVSTPIGNLEDITLRGLRVLKEAAVVAAEDTRRTLKLMSHYGIGTSLTSYHSHNKQRKGRQLVKLLQEGKDVALVSDAGTPGLSDPGYDIIREALDAGITVVPVPGPAALVAALTVSGLPAASFTFVGFLAVRKGRRRRQIEELAAAGRTVVLYEGPHRLLGTLEDMLEIMGDRRAVVSRELTKKFEEVVRGTIQELVEHFRGTPPRGEVTVVVEGLRKPGLRIRRIKD